MRVLVYGGRDFTDKQKLFDMLYEIDDLYGPIHTIIHGDARGAEKLGEQFYSTTLPFQHYYCYGSKVVNPSGNEWIIDYWNELRTNR